MALNGATPDELQPTCRTWLRVSLTCKRIVQNTQQGGYSGCFGVLLFKFACIGTSTAFAQPARKITFAWRARAPRTTSHRAARMETQMCTEGNKTRRRAESCAHRAVRWTTPWPAQLRCGPNGFVHEPRAAAIEVASAVCYARPNASVRLCPPPSGRGATPIMPPHQTHTTPQ